MDLNAEELLTLIAAGEGRRTEFKRGLPGPEKTARTLCAFANTSGGILLVGVTDGRRVYGLEDPRAVARELRRICAENLQPPVQPEVRVVSVEDKHVVACSIPFSGARPHAVLHPDREPEITVRVGSSNRRPSGPSLKALQDGRASRKKPNALQKEILEWVERRGRRSRRPEGDCTVRAFAQDRNVGAQRAKRAFAELEREGWLVGHGLGAARVFRRC